MKRRSTESTTRHCTQWLRLTVFVSITVALTGCGSIVPGAPQPGATKVDIDTLRTGPFQREPVPFALKAGLNEPEQVRLVEARRLLNYLIQPLDIDPELHVPGKAAVFASETGMPVIQGIQLEHQRVIKDNVKFIAGVATHQTNGSIRNPRRLSIAVFQFESEAESARAAKELNQISIESSPRENINIPGIANAHASIAQDQLDSWQSHGPYVVAVSILTTQAGVDESVTLTQKALTAENHALDRHKPIPLDDVLDQPLDGENIVRRTSIPDTRDSFVQINDFGVYQPSGILHFQRFPSEARQVFTDTGVDLIGRRASTVYRARDLAAAFKLQTFLAKQGKNDTNLDPPLGVADAQCVRFDNEDDRGHNSMCAVVYGRYVAVVTAKSIGYGQFDSDLQERAAAQYYTLQKCE